MLPLGEQLGVTLLGARWQEAGRVLAALAGVTLALPFIELATEVFKAANRPDLVPRTTFIRSVGSIVLMVAFLPLGATGVAAGLSLAHLLAAAYAWRDVGRVLELRPPALARVLVAPATAATIMAGVLALLVVYVAQVDREPTLNRLAWLVLEVGVGAIVYVALLLKLSPATGTELRQVLQRLRRRDGGSPDSTVEVTSVDESGSPIV